MFLYKHCDPLGTELWLQSRGSLTYCHGWCCLIRYGRMTSNHTYGSKQELQNVLLLHSSSIFDKWAHIRFCLSDWLVCESMRLSKMTSAPAVPAIYSLWLSYWMLTYIQWHKWYFEGSAKLTNCIVDHTAAFDWQFPFWCSFDSVRLQEICFHLCHVMWLVDCFVIPFIWSYKHVLS